MELEQYLKTEQGIDLTPQQVMAMEAAHGTTLLLAVPGSGKTTVLAARVAHLILCGGVEPGSVLAVSYNRESARDLGKRFEELFGSLVPSLPRFGTMHSFCFEVLARYARAKGQPVPVLLEGEQSPIPKSRLLRDCYISAVQEYPDEDTLADLEQAAGYVAGSMLKPEDEAFRALGFPHLGEILGKYQGAKRQNGWMDYDDLLTFAHSIFRTRPDILDFFQSKYRHICVDEAQDLSPVQFQVVQQMAARYGNLFLVGDEDQSIYSFRGADPGMLMELSRQEGTRLLKLEQNFRSTRVVVDGASKVIANNKQRHPKEMVTHREQGKTIRTLRLSDAVKLGEQMVEKVTSIPDGETVAVLYRNAPSAIAIADCLNRAGIPFFYRGGQGGSLLRQTITQDVLRILRLSTHPDDVEAFGSVYYKLGAYISREMVDYVSRNISEGQSVFDLAAEAPGATNTARLSMLKYTLQRFGRMAPAKVLSSILHDFGYLDYLSRNSKDGYYFELSVQRLRALEYIAGRSGTLDGFVEQIHNLDAVLEEAGNRRGERLVLSTIHSAKGLEFDRVFVVDLQEGILPANQAIDEYAVGREKAMEEERRLFYVALTRARNHLAVVCSESFGSSRLTPSRFLAELYGASSQGEAFPELIAGKKMYHRYFGMGTVQGVDRLAGTFSVQCAKQGRKVFVIDVLENELLAKLVD